MECQTSIFLGVEGVGRGWGRVGGRGRGGEIERKHKCAVCQSETQNSLHIVNLIKTFKQYC